MVIVQAKLSDLTTIMQIERAGFTPDEAASPAAMRERIQTIADTFLVARDETERVLGFVVGPVIGQEYLTDDLFDRVVPNPSDGGYQSILSLAVDPTAQGHHTGSALLTALADIARAQQRVGMTLTCLERLIPFYQRNGYRDAGIADSTHAGEVWHNMVLKF